MSTKKFSLCPSKDPRKPKMLDRPSILISFQDGEEATLEFKTEKEMEEFFEHGLPDPTLSKRPFIAKKSTKNDQKQENRL